MAHHEHVHHHHEDPVIEGKDFVDVVSTTLNSVELTQLVESEKAGAISTFAGVTRDHHGGKKVLRLEYEAYVPMAVSELQKICETIRKRWSVIHVAIYHRIGEVPILQSSVFIAVSSIHRRDALEATHFAIDELKATVPIWKKEFYEDGSVWKENQEYRDRHPC